MDSEVLKFLLILAVTIVFSLAKRKKKQASAPQKKHSSPDTFSDEFSFQKADAEVSANENFNHWDYEFSDGVNEQFEVDNSEVINEKNEAKYAKTEPYFTYEANVEETSNLEQNQGVTDSKSAHFPSQEVDNEEETLRINLHDPEDLKKAVLYGEILKNPYIQ